MIEIENVFDPKEVHEVVTIRVDVRQLNIFIDGLDPLRKQYVQAIRPGPEAEVSDVLKFLMEVAKFKELKDNLARHDMRRLNESR